MYDVRLGVRFRNSSQRLDLLRSNIDRATRISTAFQTRIMQHRRNKRYRFLPTSRGISYSAPGLSICLADLLLGTKYEVANQ